MHRLAPGAGALPYRWEFTEGRRDFSVAVSSRVLNTDGALLVRLARAGVGLAMVDERRVRGLIARSELEAALEEFSTPFPGFYLHYPQRRHASPALRALVDYLRWSKRPTPRPTPPAGSFARGLREPAFVPGEALAGKDVRTLARDLLRMSRTSSMPRSRARR